MATVKVNRSLVQSLMLTGSVNRRMARFGNEVKREAQARVGVKSGRLRDSITVRQGHAAGKVFVRVGPVRVPYAELHHEGTKPHVIYPRRRQALKFVPTGGTTHVFRRRVFHPGTKPNRYLAEAFNAALRRFN